MVITWYRLAGSRISTRGMEPVAQRGLDAHYVESLRSSLVRSVAEQDKHFRDMGNVLVP